MAFLLEFFYICEKNFMKHKDIFVLLFYFLFSSVNISAQDVINPIGKEIHLKYVRPKVSKIKIKAPVKVILKISSEINYTDVEIKGHKNIISLLRVKAKDNELFIEFETNKIIKSNDYPIVNITMPSIAKISLLRTAELVSISPLILKNLSVNVSDASIAKFPVLDVEYLTFNVSGSSIVKVVNLKKSKKLNIVLSGVSDFIIQKCESVEQANLSVSGSSDLKIRNVYAKNVKIDVSGTSSAYIYASEFVEVNASGASDVFIYGNPKKITKHIADKSNLLIK